MKNKSKVITEIAKKFANETGKIFVDWNSLTEAQRIMIVNNPLPFYVLVDIKFDKYLTKEVKGLPKFKL